MRQKISSKEEILSIALEIISSEGVESCTSRKLANECNVAVGTIYNYFTSRDELLRACFIHSWNETSKKLRKVCSESVSSDLKMKKFLSEIEKDIKKRNSLGAFLVQSNIIDFKKEKEPFFYEAQTLIKSILLDSSKYDNYSGEELMDLAKWIIYGHILFAKGSSDTENYQNLVIKTLLKL